MGACSVVDFAARRLRFIGAYGFSRRLRSGYATCRVAHGCSVPRQPRRSGVKTTPAASLFDTLSRIVFGVAATILMLLAVVLIGDVILQFASVVWSRQQVSMSALTGIGYVVVAIAVFDVAKYLIEEEVVRAREMRAAGEARRSLTQFISTIAIAVFLEALVTVFRVSKDNVTDLVYPTMLLLAAILLVVGLGVYQRLSAEVERQVGHQDRAAEDKKNK
jgi:hypothetical protein